MLDIPRIVGVFIFAGIVCLRAHNVANIHADREHIVNEQAYRMATVFNSSR